MNISMSYLVNDASDQIYFSGYFDPSKADGNNTVPILINALTETSRFYRKFYFSETEFLAFRLESMEREVKKTIESRQHY